MRKSEIEIVRKGIKAQDRVQGCEEKHGCEKGSGHKKDYDHLQEKKQGCIKKKDKEREGKRP